MAFETRDYASPGPFGGAGRGFGPGSTGPSGWTITTWLIVINAAVFLLAGIFGGSARADGADPLRWGYFSVNKAIWGLEVWRFLTYQFLHADFFHILFNMIGLYFFGPLLERELGRRAFLAFYLLCGVSGAVIATVLGTLFGPTIMHPDAPLVGASGALFGILAAAAVRFPHLRVQLLIPPIPMSMRTMALVFLGIAALSVLVGSRNAGGEAAHLGGALLGFVLMKRPGLLAPFGGPALGAAGYGAAKRSGGGIEGIKGRLADFKRNRARKAAAEHAAEVDRILAKVSDSGIQSLTEGEKKTLAEDTKRKR
ncbi:rhomboid family intramembrane serine protease [Phycisphaera mikurensis]|uniref:Rhomboid family protein n=1 Tax=Phycisphaera mikurensis (strain NBRC 102666 / KCTC 22515 / FYK2301M01) TaxID=1142394 RepID=I0IGV0_PHYMF|nr:rhomboid family intramembrane serine protease [Phycisphaera mikurensis]MBB6440745.1 membrane associated rhomboid family serine protease [Phycisphaera mikurensis]BAM04488.1 rhomboid family protein [Phycisphaera mikurensis NBRC 102666]